MDVRAAVVGVTEVVVVVIIINSFIHVPLHTLLWVPCSAGQGSVGGACQDAACGRQQCFQDLGQGEPSYSNTVIFCQV